MEVLPQRLGMQGRKQNSTQKQAHKLRSAGHLSANRTTKQERQSPSYIPTPSRLSRMSAPAGYNRQKPRSVAPLHCAKISPEEPLTTHIPSLSTTVMHRPQVDFSGTPITTVRRHKAWEEKIEPSSLQCESDIGDKSKEKVENCLGDSVNSTIYRKAVSFANQLPSYKNTSSAQPSSSVRHVPRKILPELGKVSGDVDKEVDGVAGITPSLHLTRNGLKRHHVTDSHTTLEESLRQKQKELQKEHVKAMSDVRERHQLELSNERQRLQRQILTLSGMQQKQTKSHPNQQRVYDLEQKLANKTAECCNLQAELNAKKVELESEERLKRCEAKLQAQVESLQSQLNACELEQTDIETANSSEKQRLQQYSQKQQQKLMAKLASTQEQNALLHRQLAALNRQLIEAHHTEFSKYSQTETSAENVQNLVTIYKQEVEQLQRTLTSEKQKYEKLQEKLLEASSELESCQNLLTESQAQVKQQKGSLEQIDAKKSISQEPHGQLIELQTQNAMLTADLSTAQQSLERKMALLEQSHYNHNSAKRRMADLESEMLEMRTALAHSEAQLSQMREKCLSLESSLETSFSTQLNESQVSQLKGEAYESKLELEALNSKLQMEMSTSLELKDELDCTQKECAAFQDQLQLQRESAALCLNRIQQAGYKKQKRLVQKIKDLQRAVKQVELAEQKAKSQCQAHVVELTHETEKLKDASKQQSEDLKEKKASLKLAKEQIQGLTKMVEEHKASEDSLQAKLSSEAEAHTECRTQLSQHREKLVSTRTECERLNNRLTESISIAEQERKKNISLQLLVTETKQQLSAFRQSIRQREKEAKTNLALLKKEHHNKMRALTFQLEDLNTISHNLQEKEKQAVMELERMRESMNAECQQLQADLASVNKELEEEIRKSTAISEENGSLKTRLSDLQNKVSELTSAQRDYEDYTHKLQESTKHEMHHMLEEMAQHIQQQSDSHMYLEKLRIENEQMALHEKDRQIQDLKHESMALQQQRQQEEVLIESLKFENQLMRAQLRRHTRGSYQREAALKGHNAFSSVTESHHSRKLPPINDQRTIKETRHTTTNKPYSFFS